MPTMPFGRYVGRDLTDIPATYLRWLLDSVELYGGLDEDVRDELARRARARGEPPPPTPDDPPPSALRDLVGRWHRQLSLRHHPDRGGHPAAMAAVNDARDELLDLLREEGMLS